MKIRVEGHEPIEFDPARSIAELAQRVAAATGATLSADSHLLVVDSERFFESPQSRSDALAPHLRSAETDEIALRLCPVTRCMHGSPAVPERGFLCGWC